MLTSIRAPGDAVVLRQALRAQRGDLLPRLLDLGLDPNWRGANQKSALEQAILNGNTEAVRLFIARGARIEVSMDHSWGGALDLAAASLDADMLALVTRDWALPLDKVCLPDTPDLIDIVMNASDTYWDLLLKHGFATAPQQCEHAMAPRLITAFAEEPGLILAGWLGQRFAARRGTRRHAGHPGGRRLAGAACAGCGCARTQGQGCRPGAATAFAGTLCYGAQDRGRVADRPARRRAFQLPDGVRRR